MAAQTEDDLELSLAKIAIVLLILLWLVLPYLLELQAQPLDVVGSAYSTRTLGGSAP